MWLNKKKKTISNKFKGLVFKREMGYNIVRVVGGSGQGKFYPYNNIVGGGTKSVGVVP